VAPLRSVAAPLWSVVAQLRPVVVISQTLRYFGKYGTYQWAQPVTAGVMAFNSRRFDGRGGPDLSTG